MRHNVMRSVMLVLGIMVIAAVAGAQESQSLKTDQDKMSYAIGVDLARKFLWQGIQVEKDAMLQGMGDVLARAKLLMTEEDIQVALNEFQTELKRTRARALRYAAEENKRKGTDFLAANKVKEGVVTLPSGLQYKILQEGKGAKPTAADTVMVKYRGALINGTEIDSSYHQGGPAMVKVTGGLAGWEEALQLMPVGSIWQLFIPPELAYGAKGHAFGKRVSDRSIGPYETLIFEMELVAIK